jgi:hypothetical protein
MHFILDENIMDYTSDWCTACNTEATNHIPIKEFLFGTGSAQGRGKNPFMCFRNVPTKLNLPLGMRIMNDAYVFIYTISCFIAVLVKNLSSSEQNQTRVGSLLISFPSPALGLGLLIYCSRSKHANVTCTCFPQHSAQNHVFFIFPPKTESDHSFPPKLKPTDLVGLSGQKPNWLGSFRAKLDFLEIELNIELKI